MKILNKKNYLDTLPTFEGSKSFRSVYAEIDGEIKDMTENGNLSCSFFVSAYLLRFTSVGLNFKLINEIHLTVPGIVKDLKTCGWYETNEMKSGAIIYWGTSPETNHTHIGFYLGNDQAISNNSKDRIVTIHSISSNGRNVEKIYWHDFLN